jgi:ABC-type thiamin/hydroxymethylpyrimidine transport system permease subunit
MPAPDFVAHGVRCFTMGALTGLATSLPFVLRRRGMRPLQAAGLGGFGSVLGAMYLHLSCPATHAGQVLAFHALPVVVVGIGMGVVALALSRRLHA